MGTVFFHIRIPGTFPNPALPAVEYDGTKSEPGKRVFVTNRPAKLTALVELMNMAYRLFPSNGEFDKTRRLARYNMDTGTGYSEGLGDEFWKLVTQFAWAVEVYDNPDQSIAVVLSQPTRLFNESGSPVMVKNPEDKNQETWQGNKFQTLNYSDDGTYFLQ